MNSKKNLDPLPIPPIEKMSLEGSAAAMRQLALTYLQGNRTDRDQEYGRQLLLTAGRSADRAASRLLADYYLSGRFGFPKDREQSTYWWLRSERRLWSEQSPLYRYKLWKLSWEIGADMSTLM
ncbi:MAG: hypothetical protein HY274_04730 [Gammaproteobacteria bacterium]|nr:hypothetical protein [Gammaproteobacteria bacterium]